MPTQLLAPATAAANTADQTIPTGSTLTFGLYTTAGGLVPSDADIPITRKNASGTYNLTGAVLNAANPNVVIAYAGTYRAEKPLTNNAIGVEVD